ncbi:MAG: outer membrane beta-barrel protein [candidate division Zixibacteria bacterium]
MNIPVIAKSILLTTAIILSTSLSLSAQQSTRAFNFSISGGRSSPTGPADFTRYWGSGLNYEFSVAYEPSRLFHLGISARMDNFPLNEMKIQQEATELGVTTLYDHRDISIFSMSIFARTPIIESKNRLKPYLFIQISESWPNTGFVYASNSDSAWVFARPMQKDRLNSFGFGLGSDYRISEKFSLSLEFGYRVIFTYYKISRRLDQPDGPIINEKGKNSNDIFVSFGLRYSITVY